MSADKIILLIALLLTIAWLIWSYLFQKPKKDLYQQQKQNWRNSGYSHPPDVGDSGGDGGD